MYIFSTYDRVFIHSNLFYSTKIRTADNERKSKSKRKGKGRQGAKKQERVQRRQRDTDEDSDGSNCKGKDSTLSTSSLIGSEDSEWHTPVQDTKPTPEKSKPRRTSITPAKKARGVRRKTKEESKNRRAQKSRTRTSRFDHVVVTQATV